MPSPARRPALRLLLLFAVWAALVTGWSYAARDLLPVAERDAWPPDLARRAPPLARWDAGWYRTIAEQGYGPPPPPRVFSEHAFFPLYPLTVRAVSRVTGADFFAAAVGVSIGAFLAAGFLFAREAVQRLGEADAASAALFLLLFPAAFFFAAAYSESLFLLLSLAAFGESRRGRASSSVLAGILAGLTRPAALALAVPLFVAWREAEAESASRRSKTSWAKAIAVGAAPAVAALGWILALGIARGEPGLFFRVQKAWDRAAGLGPLTRRASPALLLEAGCLLLFAFLAVRQAKRRRLADAAWTAGAILLPVSTGTLMSLPRYLAVVYPAFFTLSELFAGKPRARIAWWIASGALLAACVAAFVHWRWVA